jgi:hypothetical protein
LVITIFIQLYPVRWKFKSSLKSICWQ